MTAGQMQIFRSRPAVQLKSSLHFPHRRLSRASLIPTYYSATAVNRGYATASTGKMATPSTKTFTLNTGAHIPAVGLGTWQSPPGQVKTAVLTALKAGYRHIDCAFMYQNEEEVGNAFKEAFGAGVCKREDVFVTTKLWCTFHSRVQEALQMSLDKLGLDYIDLYLMHWPVPMNPAGNHPLIPKLADGSRDLAKDWSHVQTWQELEKLAATGKAKAVGVSNYSVPFLKELLAGARITPAVNQIENHPYLPQQEIVDFCREKGILVTAYSPLGSTDTPLMKEDGVVKIAQKRGVSAGTVLISYALARGISAIPKSVTPSRIEENLKTVELDKEDMDALEGIHKTKGVQRLVYPAFGVNLGFPDKQ